MNVVLTERSANNAVIIPNVDFQVERYSHAAIGGPKLARVRATGDDLSLWRLIEMIRFGLDIYSEKGDALWWGEIYEVQATVRSAAALSHGTDERVRVGITKQNMANYIWVAYTEVDLSGTAVLYTRDTIGPISDAESLRNFGTVELLWTKDSASSAHASAAGTAYMQQHKYPRAVIAPAFGARTSEALITCRGWWDTLNDRLYNNDGTATLDTASQAGTITATRSQFISGVDVEDTSGIDVSQYRDGDATALFEVVQMLEMGTDNYRRLLANVDKNRRVRIYEEPSSDVVYYSVRANGDVYNRSEKVRLETCPVAVWARASDVVPAPIGAEIVGDASLLFIEESEYNVKERTLTITPRGALDPWRVTGIKDG